ncbi:Inositol-pentakisphosphate 2-kinase [Paramyrothecium foliicola]|nr:Inositol-pentakisphosphate 2-kinase [Paramyrothecium foliicola]
MASQASPPQPIPGSRANGHLPLQDFPSDDIHSWIEPHDMALLRDIGNAAGHATNGSSYLHTLKQLPKGTRPVSLIGEGSANAVFEIKIPETNRHAPAFRGLLLRVAKVAAPGLAPTYDYLRQQKFFQSVIQPVLGDYTVRQELVILYNSDIVAHLNKYLRSIDHHRKDKFKGTFVGQSDWGLLVEDMRPQEHVPCLFFEFKPKWLLQSPSAPRNAIRCRQCAMELYHMVTKPASQKCLPKDKPCPIALGNDHAHPRVSSPLRIAWDVPSRQLDESFGEVLRQAANHPAISELRKLQGRLDHVGPLNVSPENSDFNLAMTLRDCTFFVQIADGPSTSRSPPSLKVRLSDFDWKDPNAKSDRWRRAEEDLIKGGYYTADWIVCGGQLFHPPTLCALEWKARRRTDEIEVLCLVDEGGSKRQEAVNDDMSTRLPAKVRTYHHSTDLKILQKKLKPFRMEPLGTPPDCVYNPFRADPREAV